MEGCPTKSIQSTSNNGSDSLDELFDEHEVLSRDLKVSLVSMGVTMEKLMTMTESDILMLERLNSFQTNLSCDLILFVSAVNDYKQEISSNRQNDTTNNIQTKTCSNQNSNLIETKQDIKNFRYNNNIDISGRAIMSSISRVAKEFKEKLNKYLSRHQVQIRWFRILCEFILLAFVMYVSYLVVMLLFKQNESTNLCHFAYPPHQELPDFTFPCDDDPKIIDLRYMHSVPEPAIKIMKQPHHYNRDHIGFRYDSKRPNVWLE